MNNGATILAPLGTALSRDERAFFAAADPWGFILFARNIETPEQVSALTAELRASVGRDAPVFIDQEGGRVQRLRPPHWREWLPPLEQAQKASNPARSFWLRYRIIADELRVIGIDGNCAPTCDIAMFETHPFLKSRCLGETVDEVVANARASADGLLAGGVLPVIKHMPGHGRGQVDSHLRLPVADVDVETARATDFAVFRALSDLPLGMSAHIVYPDFGEKPATQNAGLIGEIRDCIDFNGLLMTDDISMEALEGSVADRAQASLAAGCDLVLHCNGELTEMEAIADVAGQLSPEAQARADHALTTRKTPTDIDIKALEAELGAMFA